VGVCVCVCVCLCVCVCVCVCILSNCRTNVAYHTLCTYIHIFH